LVTFWFPKFILFSGLEIKLRKIGSPHISYLLTWEKFPLSHTAHHLSRSCLSDDLGCFYFNIILPAILPRSHLRMDSLTIIIYKWRAWGYLVKHHLICFSIKWPFKSWGAHQWKLSMCFKKKTPWRSPWKQLTGWIYKEWVILSPQA